jgi:hypothetical protein
LTVYLCPLREEQPMRAAFYPKLYECKLCGGVVTVVFRRDYTAQLLPPLPHTITCENSCLGYEVYNPSSSRPIA